ncbi:26581_t:CDS:2, partial [Gigaspora margarita]
HLNRHVNFLINELAINILRNYHEETIQCELNIGRMGSHYRTRKFEINLTNIDDNSIFQLHESLFIIKLTQGEYDYILDDEEQLDDDKEQLDNNEEQLDNEILLIKVK